MERLLLFLTKIFIGNGYSFTCSGWRNLFRIQERVYKEFCVEFFLTVTFQETVQDPHWPQALVFGLGGEYRECSLVQFAWRFGLYDRQEAMNPEFGMFFSAAARGYTEGVTGYVFWQNIVSGCLILECLPRAVFGPLSIAYSTVSSHSPSIIGGMEIK